MNELPSKCIHLISPAHWCCICKLADLKNLQSIKAAVFEEGRVAGEQDHRRLRPAPNPYAV